MLEPKVSIIVPVYKAEKYIERCVRSLFEQTLDLLEYIFVDDCTPDQSIEIVEQVLKDYPNRKEQVKIIRHKVNQGVAVARQHGFENSFGQYVIHCDPDDWVELDMYETMWRKAQESRADICICGFFINFKTKQKPVCEKYAKEKYAFLHQIITGEIHNGLCNKLIRRDVLKRLDFLFTAGLNLWEDVSVLARIVYCSKRIALLNQSLYHYDQSNLLSYTHRWKHEYTENVDEAVRINFDFFRSKGINVDAIAQRGLYTILCNESHEIRKIYLEKYKALGCITEINYQIFSPFGKILVWNLFAGRFFIADFLRKLRMGLIKLSR